MSYEGYTEYLCERGHFFTRDAYESDPVECDVCKRDVAHFHPVDQTNGVVEDDPTTHPAEKFLIEEEWTERYSYMGTPYKVPVLRWRPSNEWRTWRRE